MTCQSFIQFTFAVRNPYIDFWSKPTAFPFSDSLSSSGSSMHTSRSTDVIKCTLLMSKIVISSSSPSTTGTLSLTRSSNNTLKIFPWGHCTEEFIRKQGSLCPRAQLSPHKSVSHVWSVCVSFACDYALDGYNCDVSALFTDFWRTFQEMCKLQGVPKLSIAVLCEYVSTKEAVCSKCAKW